MGYYQLSATGAHDQKEYHVKTKLPTELVLGDRLAAYGLQGQRLAPSRVLSDADAPVAGTVFVMTTSGPLRLEATIPAEIED